MNTDKQRQKYLQKAKEAEEQAAQSKDQSIRDSWLKIAATYRDLAKSN